MCVCRVSMGSRTGRGDAVTVGVMGGGGEGPTCAVTGAVGMRGADTCVLMWMSAKRPGPGRAGGNHHHYRSKHSTPLYGAYWT